MMEDNADDLITTELVCGPIFVAEFNSTINSILKKTFYFFFEISLVINTFAFI